MLEKYQAGRCTLGWLVYKCKTYLQAKKNLRGHFKFSHADEYAH